MKRQLLTFSAICAALILSGFQARADKVPLTQAPDAVQKAIKQHAGGETVQDLDRETKDGQVYYDVEFKRDGLNRHVRFAQDGSLISDRSGLASVLDTGPTIQLNELPKAVQKAVRDQQAGRDIADIDRETWNGKSVYEVEFKDKGPNSRIYVAEDGSLVVDKDKGVRGSYGGTQLSDTPKPVQDTVKRVAGNAEVADVDRKTKDGQTTYKVDIRQQGQDRRLLISENGMLLRDSEARGAAPSATERTTGTVREKARELFGGQTMSLNQVPAAVQKTIKDSGEIATLKSIKQEQKDGTTSYDVEFEKEGKNTRLKIAGDGRILEDNRR